MSHKASAMPGFHESSNKTPMGRRLLETFIREGFLSWWEIRAREHYQKSKNLLVPKNNCRRVCWPITILLALHDFVQKHATCICYAMDMTQIFDTHAAVKDLVASGLNEQQAEAITTTTRRLAETNLATKEDIAVLRVDLYKTALLIVGLNTAVTFGLLKLFLP